MAFEASFADDYDPTEPDRPTWGKYHAAIIRVDEDGGKHGSMVVDFEILAGDPDGEEGKVHRDYFHKTIKAFRRIHQLAIACGMVTADQLKDMKSRGVSPTYDFAADAVDKHLFIQLERDEYEGKERAKLGFAIYHPYDPKVQDWVKNKAMLASAGYDVSGMTSPAPQSQSSEKNGAASTQPQPSPENSAAGAGAELGDIFENVF